MCPAMALQQDFTPPGAGSEFVPGSGSHERWRKREGPVSFPEGTYKMRDYPGVVSERAPPVSCQAA